MTDKIFMWCDGACRNNGGEMNLGAAGYILTYRNKTKEDVELERNTTNNRMELMACILGLQAIKDKTIPVEVFSDSNYLVKGINEWIYKWMSTDWRNAKEEEVKNKDLWMQLMQEKIKFHSITFTHCKGHADNEMNNQVDFIINYAMDNEQKRIAQNEKN